MVDAVATQITGLVLAGGAGRRMGGLNKGLLQLRERPLVGLVIERLAPQVAGLLISANRDLEAYAAFGYPVLPDNDPEAFQGPLAGLAVGLAACPTPWLLTCPCDCPALPHDLAARLFSAAQAQGVAITVAATAGRMQPTFQLCRRELLPMLQAYLAAGHRKLGQWCHAQGAREVNFPDTAGAFDNLNTPGDLAAAIGQ